MKYENEQRFKELAERLRKEIPLSDPRWNDAQDVINSCEAGDYHDFETTLATPKMQMVEDLRKIGYEDEAQRVINGDYDQ